MLKAFSTNSAKYIRTLVKNIPDKVYSIEIKVKSKPQVARIPQDSASSETIESSQSSQAIEKVTKLSPPTSATTDDHSELEDYYRRDRFIVDDNISDKLSQLVRSLETKSGCLEKSSISTAVHANNVMKQFYAILRSHPELIDTNLSHKVITSLLKVNQTSARLEAKYSTLNEHYAKQYNVLRQNSLNILAQLGHVGPPKGKGVRILSIDGGGTRGILIIEALRQIEQAYGKPIYEIFDLICGVSTGAIISLLLGALRTPVDECEKFYRHISSYLFNTDIISGTSRLLWSHAYYDTAVWEKILKQTYGSEAIMADTKKHPDCPNIVAVSAVVNLQSLQPYLFRNYQLSPAAKPFSHFEGSSQHKLWEAVRASAAAPGYFEEFTLGKHVHQDGGILINNPTAVAVHEAKLLWPNEQIQCVLSLGSGRYQPDKSLEEKNAQATPSSLKHKIARLIDSATDTEMVHRLMQDLLPFNTYYRINPIIRDPASIDENRPEKLENMKVDAQMYLRQNSHKFTKLMENLKVERSYGQQVKDVLRTKFKALQ